MALLTFKKREKTTSKESWVSSVSQPYTAQEVRAGFLILFCALTLAAMLLLSGKTQFFTNARTARVGFNYIGGLEKNSPVHYAGHKVGKVTNIELTNKPGSLITVTLALSKDVMLKSDSQIFIDSMGFMGEKYIEITVGTPDSPAAEDGKILSGTDPMPMMELVKKGTDLIQEFEETNESLKRMMADLSALLGDNKENLNGIISNLNETTENVKDMTGDLKYHPWKLVRKGKEKSAEEIAKLEAQNKA
jgi:phospholipid/cholesterol/gamma-HCH transport system substrate-binding protein